MTAAMETFLTTGGDGGIVWLSVATAVETDPCEGLPAGHVVVVAAEEGDAIPRPSGATGLLAGLDVKDVGGRRWCRAAVVMLVELLLALLLALLIEVFF